MSKKVRLTWKNDRDDIFEEEVYLLDENDPVYIAGENELESKPIFGDGEESFVALVKDMVVFEDEEGIFLLEPKQVIFIVDVE